MLKSLFLFIKRFIIFMILFMLMPPIGVGYFLCITMWEIFDKAEKIGKEQQRKGRR